MDVTREAPPLRVGMIGCGLVMELKHMQVLPRIAGVRVVAAADTDARALERVADAFAISRRHRDLRALLDDREVDAVAVCTPPGEHEAAVLAAIDAGKHVLVEKPLALDLEACDRMIARACGAGVKVMVGFHMRFHGQAMEARRRLRAGELGVIEAVRSVWSNPIRLQRDLPAWRERRETGGGCLIELGVHQYDLWRYLLDADVVEIAAAVRGRDWPDESATLIGRMSNGALVSSLLSEVSGYDMEFEVYGRDGRLRLACLRYDGLEQFAAAEPPGGLRRAAQRLAAAFGRLPLALANGAGGDYLASYRNEWQHFAACIRDDLPVGCTLEDGRHAVAVARAAAQSAASGAPVAIAPAADAARVRVA